MNSREQLEAAAMWLGYQHEDLSYGIKSPEDGLKLWKAWVANDKLPEFCDMAINSDEENEFTAFFIATLGYDPLGQDSLDLED